MLDAVQDDRLDISVRVAAVRSLGHECSERLHAAGAPGKLEDCFRAYRSAARLAEHLARIAGDDALPSEVRSEAHDLAEEAAIRAVCASVPLRAREAAGAFGCLEGVREQRGLGGSAVRWQGLRVHKAIHTPPPVRAAGIGTQDADAGQGAGQGAEDQQLPVGANHLMNQFDKVRRQTGAVQAGPAGLPSAPPYTALVQGA